MVAKKVNKNTYRRINPISEWYMENKKRFWTLLCSIVGFWVLIFGYILTVALINR